jgi:gamma-glutamyltranspeptidase/glutathione hydrolase
VIDDAGMSVSLIQSNYTGIGSGISAGDTGVWLQNRGSGFTLEPGHPNEAAPGRRPLHTLAPTLWTRDGEAALLLGTRGGPHQPQYLAQVAALLLRAGTDPVAAQQFPRWHIPASDGASRIEIEETAPAPLLQGLRDRGHHVTPRPAWQRGWGPVALITIDGDGIRRGVADPRVSTATARAR